jgi:hypothetical protein
MMISFSPCCSRPILWPSQITAITPAGWACFISRIEPAPFSSSLAGLPLRLLLLADRTAPRVSLGGIQCGRAWIRGAVGGRACGASGTCEQVHARCSGKIPKGPAATRKRRRGGAWSPRTARPWRGRGLAMAVAARGAWQGKARAKAMGSGMARVRGAGARARARVLVFQSRGMDVPCAGHRHPGPAARRGGEGRRRLRGHGGGAVWQNRLNYSGSSALMIAVQL